MYFKVIIVTKLKAVLILRQWLVRLLLKKNLNRSRTFVLGWQFVTDGHCSHKIKIYLLLGRKAMTNLDSILERRDIILLTKVHIVKAMIFQQLCTDVGAGPWLKNWCFLIVVLEKTLENPSDSREIQPVILNDPTSPECSLKGQMLKLKLHYFGHLMRRADSLEKTLILGKIEGKRRGWEG